MYTVIAIKLNDPLDPIELQDWFNANPDVATFRIFTDRSIIYIVY